MLALVVSTAACATAPARPAAPAGPLRAIGRVALDDGGMRASFDVALAVAGERARLDLALPTGTAALVLWLDDARWILVDMLGREVWSGTLAELGAAWPALAPPIQAALILPGAAGTLIGADAFDTITSWRSAAAASSPTGDAWSVGFAGEPLPWTGPSGLAWPRVWSVERPGLSMEVTWSQLAPLDADGRRGLVPRVPSGMPLRSLSSPSP